MPVLLVEFNPNAEPCVCCWLLLNKLMPDAGVDDWIFPNKFVCCCVPLNNDFCWFWPSNVLPAEETLDICP